MPTALVSAGLWKLRPGTASRPRPLRPRTATVPGRSPGAGSSRLAVGHATRYPANGRQCAFTTGCHRSASKVAGVPAGPGGERKPDLRAEVPARYVSLPGAGSHGLNGLPVHRSIAVAGRRGQANGGEPAVHIGNKTEWPAFMAASRSRRGGRHLIPSRVLIKGHTETLRARAGYCPEVATPACRSRVRVAFRPARPVPACRQAARPTPLRGMPPRRLRQHCRDTPGCAHPVTDGLWSSARCTT
jgi:hypothetical protein